MLTWSEIIDWGIIIIVLVMALPMIVGLCVRTGFGAYFRAKADAEKTTETEKGNQRNGKPEAG